MWEDTGAFNPSESFFQGGVTDRQGVLPNDSDNDTTEFAGVDDGLTHVRAPFTQARLCSRVYSQKNHL